MPVEEYGLVMVSSPKILVQCAAKASLFAGSLVVKAAIWFASESSCWSKNIGRSLSITSRSRTSLVKGPGVRLAMSFSPFWLSRLTYILPSVGIVPPMLYSTTSSCAVISPQGCCAALFPMPTSVSCASKMSDQLRKEQKHASPRRCHGAAL